MLHGDLYHPLLVGTLNFKMPHWIHKLQRNAFGFLNQKMLLRCYQNRFKSWDRERNFRDSNRINRLSCHRTANCPNNLKRTSVSQSETVVKIVIVLSRVSAKKTNSKYVSLVSLEILRISGCKNTTRNLLNKKMKRCETQGMPSCSALHHNDKLLTRLCKQCLSGFLRWTKPMSNVECLWFSPPMPIHLPIPIPNSFCDHLSTQLVLQHTDHMVF